MAVTKQGSIKLSSELDAEAFKSFKSTHFSDKSNSQVLMWLLDLGTKYLENENLVPKSGTKYLDSVPKSENIVPEFGEPTIQLLSTDSTSKLNNLEYQIEVLQDMVADLTAKINKQDSFNKYVKEELCEIYTEIEGLK